MCLAVPQEEKAPWYENISRVYAEGRYGPNWEQVFIPMEEKENAGAPSRRRGCGVSELAAELGEVVVQLSFIPHMERLDRDGIRSMAMLRLMGRAGRNETLPRVFPDSPELVGILLLLHASTPTCVNQWGQAVAGRSSHKQREQQEQHRQEQQQQQQEEQQEQQALIMPPTHMAKACAAAERLCSSSLLINFINFRHAQASWVLHFF